MQSLSDALAIQSRSFKNKNVEKDTTWVTLGLSEGHLFLVLLKLFEEALFIFIIIENGCLS